MGWVAEYAAAFLLFVFEFDGKTWGQWDCPDRLLPRYKSSADKRSPEPPEPAFYEWRSRYRSEGKAFPRSCESFLKSSETFLLVGVDAGAVEDVDGKPLCAPTSGARVSEADSLLLDPEEKQPSQRAVWFNAFWLKYSLWRNRDKKRAKAIFARVVKSEATFQAVMAGIDSQDAEMMSREPAHRMHATTFLNGRRWEDSPEEGRGVAGKREPASGAVSRGMDILYGEQENAA
jgi:hypothetical protein